MVIINKLVNLFKKNKNKIDYSKFGMGCIPSPEDENDYIWEEVYNIPTPPKNKKCNYYLGRKKVDNDRAFIVKDDKGKEFLGYFNKLPKASDIFKKGDTTNKVNEKK